MKHLLIFLICCANMFGAAFLSDATGNWNSHVTWGKADGAPNVEGVNYPGASDTVTIAAGHQVTLNIATINATSITNAGNGVCLLSTDAVNVINANLIVGGTEDLITLNAGTGDLTINGTITAAGGTSGDDGIDLGAQTGTFTFAGNLTGGPNACNAIIASGACTIVANIQLIGGTSGAGIKSTSATATLTIGTLVFADGKAIPIAGNIGSSYSVTAIVVNGVALGGSSGGTRWNTGDSRYNQ